MMLLGIPPDGRRKVRHFAARTWLFGLLLCLVSACFLAGHGAGALEEESDGDAPVPDLAAAPEITVATAADVVCSANTTSTLAATAAGVNVTGHGDSVVWSFHFRKVGGQAAPVREVVSDFNDTLPSETLVHLWNCPSELGRWNVTVLVCDGKEDFSCTGAGEILASTVVQVTVQVGHKSVVAPVARIIGCQDGVNSTSLIDASVADSAGAPLPKVFHYLFKFHAHLPGSTADGVAEDGDDGGPFRPIVNSNGELVTNASRVRFDKEWNCEGGVDAGVWDVLVEVRDNATAALIAYNVTTVTVTKYAAELVVNGNADFSTVCSSDAPLALQYTLLGTPSPSLDLVQLKFSAAGAPRAVNISDWVGKNVSGVIPFAWPCPQAFGRYTITLQMREATELPLVNGLLAQTQANVTVIASLSSGLVAQQHTHNRHRSLSPMAIGPITFAALNATVTGLPGRSLDDFFGAATYTLEYEWRVEGNGSFVTSGPVVNHTFTRPGTYSPSVTLRVVGATPETAGVLLGTGKTVFPDLEIVGFVQTLTMTGPQHFELGSVGILQNYSLLCNLSAPSDQIITRLCWNLTLQESNSTLNVPFQPGCHEFHGVEHMTSISHFFNVTGVYVLDLSCSNEVSYASVDHFVVAHDVPTPPSVPVVSYTLPIVLTLVLGGGGFTLLAFLVYRRRKNRHIQVADFDYLRDWDDPRRAPSFKDRCIDRMGRVCGCLPGPWHWRKSERTQRYLSLAMRTNTTDYGATGSFS